MKKTLITLMALVGVAQATDLLKETWGDGYNMTVSESGLVYNADSSEDWGENAVKLDLGDIELLQNQVLTLNVTYNANSADSSVTVALVGDTYAFVGGRSFKNTTFRVGVTEEIGLSRGYAFAITNNQDYCANITTEYSSTQGSDVTAYYKNLTGTTFSENKMENEKLVTKPHSFTLTVNYDQTKSLFVGTMSMGNVSESIYLGESFQVNDVVATFVTNKTATVTNMVLSVKTIPEPTTATLSLLALAGLAARRRRR